jgi:putative membrane protein
MLVAGIGYHVMFMRGLRSDREALRMDGLVHAQSSFPISLTLLVALVLLGIGLLAVLSIAFNIGPFG